VSAPPFQSAPSFVVLHALRISGRAPTDALPDLTCLPRTVIDNELVTAADAGDVRHHDGVMTGWSLTADGRQRHAELLVAERASANRDVRIGAGYDDFIALNGWFKHLCTEWQLHGRPASCIERLHARHPEVVDIADRLAAALTRFRSYAPRFSAALGRLQTGDLDAFTKPLAGSYHDVWMLLHEDLLLTLGRERSPTDEE
jgi:hypothetical protein